MYHRDIREYIVESILTYCSIIETKETSVFRSVFDKAILNMIQFPIGWLLYDWFLFSIFLIIFLRSSILKIQTSQKTNIDKCRRVKTSI